MRNRTRLLCSLLATLVVGPIHSQQITWSSSVRNERAIERVQAVELTDTLLHVIEERDHHTLRWVRFGSESMRMVGNTEIIPASEEDKLAYYFIRRDTLHTLSTRWNRELERTEVYRMLYDTSGKRIGDQILLHQQIDSSEPRKSGLQCKLSPDSTHILLFFDSENERKQTEGIHFKCFDTQWKMAWEKDLRLPPSAEVLQVHHFLVDNSGAVYMMSGRKPLKSNADWQRPQGGQYVVYYYNAERNKLKQYDIGLKDKQVISVDFKLNTNQELVVGGYYSDNFQNKASGTLLFMLQANGGAISKAAYTPFSKEVLREMSGKEKGGLDDFFLEHLHLTINGSIVLVGEQYYASRYVSTDPTTGRQIVEYRYNYNDIMVCLMDSSGQHVWNNRVAKRQLTSAVFDSNYSYSFAADTKRLLLTFNDDPENNAPQEGKRRRETSLWSGTKNSVTTQVAIDFEGQQTRRTCVENDTERLLFNPLMTLSAPWSGLILGFDDKRTYKFCLLD